MGNCEYICETKQGAELSNVQCQITSHLIPVAPPQAKSGLKGVQSLLMYKVKLVASG